MGDLSFMKSKISIVLFLFSLIYAVLLNGEPVKPELLKKIITVPVNYLQGKTINFNFSVKYEKQSDGICRKNAILNWQSEKIMNSS